MSLRAILSYFYCRKTSILAEKMLKMGLARGLLYENAKQKRKNFNNKIKLKNYGKDYWY